MSLSGYLCATLVFAFSLYNILFSLAKAADASCFTLRKDAVQAFDLFSDFGKVTWKFLNKSL